MLQFVEDLLQLHGTGPAPVDLRTGRPVCGDHQVEDRTGNADRAGGVLVLLHSQADRHLHASLEPTIRAGGPLFGTRLDHANYSCTMLIALLARLAALRRP